MFVCLFLHCLHEILQIANCGKCASDASCDYQRQQMFLLAVPPDGHWRRVLPSRPSRQRALTLPECTSGTQGYLLPFLRLRTSKLNTTLLATFGLESAKLLICSSLPHASRFIAKFLLISWALCNASGFKIVFIGFSAPYCVCMSPGRFLPLRELRERVPLLI